MAHSPICNEPSAAKLNIGPPRRFPVVSVRIGKITARRRFPADGSKVLPPAPADGSGVLPPPTRRPTPTVPESCDADAPTVPESCGRFSRTPLAATGSTYAGFTDVRNHGWETRVEASWSQRRREASPDLPEFREVREMRIHSSVAGSSDGLAAAQWKLSQLTPGR